MSKKTTFGSYSAVTGKNGHGIANGVDLFSEDGPAIFARASKTTLEDGVVYGLDGMLPPSGMSSNPQPSTPAQEGSGGAGSFLTVPAQRGVK